MPWSSLKRLRDIDDRHNFFAQVKPAQRQFAIGASQGKNHGGTRHSRSQGTTCIGERSRAEQLHELWKKSQHLPRFLHLRSDRRPHTKAAVEP